MKVTLPNMPQRPARTYSRRRYQEAIKALRTIISNQNTAAVKLRAVELMLACYADPFPGGFSARDLKDIKTLVTEQNFIKGVNKQLDRKLNEQDESKTQAEEEAQDQKALDHTMAMFANVLDTNHD